MAALVAICVTLYWLRNVPGGDATLKNATSASRIANVHRPFVASSRRPHGVAVSAGALSATGVSVVVIGRPRFAPPPDETRIGRVHDSSTISARGSAPGNPTWSIAYARSSPQRSGHRTDQLLD